MCDICLQSPCHDNCPHAEHPPPVFVCSGCSHDIYEGDDYWDILGEQFCKECINNAHSWAELCDDWEDDRGSYE